MFGAIVRYRLTLRAIGRCRTGLGDDRYDWQISGGILWKDLQTKQRYCKLFYPKQNRRILMHEQELASANIYF